MSISMDPNPYAAPLSRCESLIPSAGEGGAHCFRVRFLAIWRVAIPVSVAALAIVVTPMVLFTKGISGLAEEGAFFVISAMVMCVLQTIGVICVKILMPVYVSDLGIRTQNSWGRYHFVIWSDITRVKPSNVLGLRSFRLYTNGSRWPLLLPRFVANPQTFWPFLLTLLAHDSPLAKAIREAGLA